MTDRLRLLAYGTTLLAVFGLAYGVGAALPSSDEPDGRERPADTVPTSHTSHGAP